MTKICMSIIILLNWLLGLRCLCTKKLLNIYALPGTKKGWNTHEKIEKYA